MRFFRSISYASFYCVGGITDLTFRFIFEKTFLNETDIANYSNIGKEYFYVVSIFKIKSRDAGVI
ncbi:hypothetical protein LAC03_11340 [Levilactobacillus acidifarinae]|nr:hypothetical protein LAC03_11340 [Levilactobacillus acidifarinae]